MPEWKMQINVVQSEILLINHYLLANFSSLANGRFFDFDFLYSNFIGCHFIMYRRLIICILLTIFSFLGCKSFFIIIFCILAQAVSLLFAAIDDYDDKIKMYRETYTSAN